MTLPLSGDPSNRLLKRAAFFDVDGTLVRCQTQKVMAKIMRQKGLLTAWDNLRIAFWFLLYKAGLIRDSLAIRREVYKTFARHEKKVVEAAFHQTVETVVRDFIRPEMKAVTEKHLRAGDLIFCLSGSFLELAEPVARVFDLQKVFATTLTERDGLYTGEWTGKILEGDEKAACVGRLAREHSIDLAVSSAYADNITDLPMLRLVGHPVVVYPDPKLRRHALKSGWPILESGQA